MLSILAAHPELAAGVERWDELQPEEQRTFADLIELAANRRQKKRRS